MTINLALYFLARLASDECWISTSYPSIDPSKRTKQTKTASDYTQSPDTELQSQIPQSKVPADRVPYWVSSTEISWRVFKADINVYFPFPFMEQRKREGKKGFYFETDKKVKTEELTSMFADMKADTQAWKAEGTKHYGDSKVCKSRHYYGGTYKAQD